MLFQFLTRLESKFLADWILQQSPTSRISAMNAVLRAIEKAKSAQEVIDKNEVFSYDREQVRQAINGPIYGKSFGKYLMLRLEYHLIDRSQPFAEFNRISVEHVFAAKAQEAAASGSQIFTPEEKEYWTDRLANLVLLSRIKNSELSNREFVDKKQKYFKSSVNLFPKRPFRSCNSPTGRLRYSMALMADKFNRLNC